MLSSKRFCHHPAAAHRRSPWSQTCRRKVLPYRSKTRCPASTPSRGRGRRGRGARTAWPASKPGVHPKPGVERHRDSSEHPRAGSLGLRAQPRWGHRPARVCPSRSCLSRAPKRRTPHHPVVGRSPKPPPPVAHISRGVDSPQGRQSGTTCQPCVAAPTGCKQNHAQKRGNCLKQRRRGSQRRGSREIIHTIHPIAPSTKNHCHPQGAALPAGARLTSMMASFGSCPNATGQHAITADHTQGFTAKTSAAPAQGGYPWCSI